MSNTKLRPCPFCGQEFNGITGVYLVNINDSSPLSGCYVECDECQSQGPWFPYGCEQQAIKGWNGKLKW